MKKYLGFVFIFIFVLTSCKKSVQNNSSSNEDQIVGRYKGDLSILVSGPGTFMNNYQFTISKTGDKKYHLTKITNSALPEFDLEYFNSFITEIDYSIKPQVISGQTIVGGLSGSDFRYYFGNKTVYFAAIIQGSPSTTYTFSGYKEP